MDTVETFKEFKLNDAGKTIWIFGAGASVVAPYSVPTQSKMLKHFLSAKYPGKIERQKRINDLKNSVREYCRYVIPGIEPEDSRLSLEEVFSAYEIVLSETRSSTDERKYAENAIREVRDALRLATYVRGRGDARKWRPHARDGVPSPYAELLEKLFPSKELANSKSNCFITFNYDIGIDRCLINLKDLVDLDLDYGIVLANPRTKNAPKFYSSRDDRGVLLLRTHGALNWIRCDACYSVFTTVNKHAYVADTQQCWACGSEKLDYVLVHPSFTRLYKDPVIQLVWGRCQEELVLSNRWVFLGYSLPMADVHFRELIRHCLRQREKSGKETKIHVVGRRQDNGDPISQIVFDNYRSLFGDKILIWESTKGGFADFVKYIV